MTREELIEKMGEAMAHAEIAANLEGDWSYYARAAIRAMEAAGAKIVFREPTDEMARSVGAGVVTFHFAGGTMTQTMEPEQTCDVFRAMFDAAPLFSESPEKDQ